MIPPRARLSTPPAPYAGRIEEAWPIGWIAVESGASNAGPFAREDCPMSRPNPNVWVAAVLSLAAGGAGGTLRAADRGAVLAVRGTRPIALGALAESAPIHPNRSYTFTRVPEPLRGLAFTSHEHKNTGPFTGTVQAAGVVYLCLQGPATPERLRLEGAWTPCGSIDTVISGRNYPWRVYRRDVSIGVTLALPAPDRWGAVVAARKITGLKLAGRTAPARRGSPASPPNEFAQLADDIAHRAQFARLADQTLRAEALILPTDRDGLDVVLRRTGALLGDLSARADAPSLAREAGELDRLRRRAAAVGVEATAERRTLFDKARALRRRIAFANPLLTFDKLLFVKRHDASGPFHMCDQYYGCNARPGGGLFVLSDPFGPAPKLTNLLADAVVGTGRLKGKTLAGGSFLSPEVSFDGREVLFAYTQAKATKTYTWSPEISYHVFKCRPDGTGLVQLTDGDADDFDPCFLPDGRIVFVSGRRGGYLRCGRHCPTYALCMMASDGGDIRRLSFHETHEWHPSVAHDGRLVYTRWDYVDRDTNVAHHLWVSYPDGRDPRSFHGNYPTGRKRRPWMEMSIRAIPGSHKYVATTGAHHGHAFGSLVVIDESLEDDGAMSQLKRLTPEAPFPEAETNPRRGMRYGTAWPLSETYYLCAYDRAARNHGLYLLDAFGNRELIYRDASIASVSPIPLASRPRPPMIPDQRVAGAPAGRDAMGTFALMNVYDGDFDWPAGTRITALRIIQVLPKTTPAPNRPRIGVGNQTNARCVLGTVPVERDGSAHFRAPAGKLVYFQALGADGLAVQSMRSGTYIQPGRLLSCQGCHEPKRRAPAPGAPTPLALRRAPSAIRPGVDGSNPFSYVRLVQPVLDRHCLDCHRRKKALDLGGELVKGGWTRSYVSLAPKYGSYYHVSNGSIRMGIHGGSRSVPGRFGARAAGLRKYLGPGHYGVKLPDADLHRVTLWLDCNTEFFGAYENTDAQARGEVVRPSLE